MKHRNKVVAGVTGLLLSAVVVGSAFAVGGVSGQRAQGQGNKAAVTSAQQPPTPIFSTLIDNPYYPISKFTRCTYNGGTKKHPESVERVRLDTFTQLQWQGMTIDAVTVRDRSFHGKEMVEETFDFYAQGADGTVYYLGEDVDNYVDGVFDNHEGSWRLGVETEIPGVIMSAKAKVGDWFRPEDVPPITLEQDIIVKDGLTKTINGVTYQDVVKVIEIQAPDAIYEYKFYAPGVGLILAVDGHKTLTNCTP
jgi:hypothetical protein